jgi:hypothetical protein
MESGGMRPLGTGCCALGGLLLTGWLLGTSERLGRIQVGLIREFTLPGAADSWPARSQDLSGWPLWCLPAFFGTVLLGCGLVLLAARRERRT